MTLKQKDIYSFKNECTGEVEYCWVVTEHCSGGCPYCVYKNNQKVISRSFRDSLPAIEFFNYMNNIKQGLCLTLIGGEPTLHPDFIKIISSLKISKINIFTNLQRDMSFWKYLVNSEIKFNILTSYHHHKTDFNSYFEKIKYLYDSGIFLDL